MKTNSPTINKWLKVNFSVSLIVFLFLGLNAMAQTPPVWSTNYPRAETTNSGVSDIIVRSKLTSASTKTYFVVLPVGSTAPTSAQVKAGQNASSTPVAVNEKGSTTNTASETEYTVTVTGYSLGSTYDIYIVAENNLGELQLGPTLKSVALPTMPTPQSLPYSQDFSSFIGTTDNDTIGTVRSYLDGWQGWKVAAATPSSSGRINFPLSDLKILVGDATRSSTGIYDFTGKIGFLSAGTDIAISLAVNTTGKSNIKITFDAMTMRNTYDGTGLGTGYKYGLILQYRVGTSATFTNLAYLPSAYDTGSTVNISGTNGVRISAGLNAILPAACDNQPIVQIRWIAKGISGSGGSRPSMAIDNVSVMQDQTLSNNADLTSLSVDEKANNNFVPLAMFGISTYNYNYYLVKGNPVPVISGVKSQSGATTVVTQATSLTGSDAEKTAKIEITAQDGTTKKTFSVKFIETDNVFQSGLYTSNTGAPIGWSQSGMYFGNTKIDGNNKFEGANYVRCISNSNSAFLRLPQTNSIGTLRFFAKKIDANVVGNFKISKKINAGEWTTVQDLGDINNSTYQEFSVAVNETATDSMFVRIEITKNGTANPSAAYYIDDFSYNAASPNAVFNPLSDTKVNVIANTVIINGAINKNLLIVTLTGQTLISRKVSNDSETIYLPTGFYVLKVGNERYKIRINKI